MEMDKRKREIFVWTPEIRAASVRAEQVYTALKYTQRTKVLHLAYWRYFVTWCIERHTPYLPADEFTVVAYLASLNPKVVKTARTAITNVHEGNGYALDSGQLGYTRRERRDKCH